MSGLIASVNTQAFTSIANIQDTAVSGEQTDNINRTVKIMEDMGRVEAQRDANGNVIAVRLTADGQAWKDFHQGGA